MHSEIQDICLNKDAIILTDNDRLVAYNFNTPLFVAEGGRLVKSLLSEVELIGERRALLQKYPYPSIIHNLIAYGVIVPKEKNSENKTADHKITPEKKSQISLYLLVSQDCNMACRYCFAGTDKYLKKTRMNYDTAKKAISLLLSSMAENSTLSIIFFGGEPLLNWPLINEIVTHCKEIPLCKEKGINLNYGITTNLSFLPRGIVQWAKKNNVGFLVDLDGDRELNDKTRIYKNGAGAYDDISKNIKILSSGKVNISLRVTVSSLNVDHLPRILEHHLELGGDSVAFPHVSPYLSDGSLIPPSLFPDPNLYIENLLACYKSSHVHWSKIWPINDFFLRVANKARMKWGCGLPAGGTCAVDSAGDIHSCIWLVGRPTGLVGSVNEEGNPFESEYFSQIQTKLLADNIEECCNCNWKLICGGGCLVRHFNTDFSDPCHKEATRYSHSIVCNTAKKLAELAIWEICQDAVHKASGNKPGENYNNPGCLR